MGEQIRVLHIMSGWELGGVQRVLLSYEDRLKAHGVIFDYVVQKAGDARIEEERIAMGSRIYRIPNFVRDPLGAMAALYRLLKQHPEYRIVHAHQNDVNLLPLMAAKLAGVPVRISHSHSCRPCPSMLKRLAKAVVHKLLRSAATEYWACSQVAYQWLYDREFSSSDRHSFVMHNALDTERFAFSQEKRAHYRQELRLEDAFTCICVGALSTNKNQQYLLQVMHKLRSCERDLKLLLVGDGPCCQQLQQQATQLDLDSRILFLGNRQDVADLLNAADCMLFPSLFEGLPVSVVEAQANGLPCIVSTATPKEVQFSPNILFYDTTDAALDRWVASVCELAEKSSDRYLPVSEAVQRGGFDIKYEHIRLAERYKELNGTCEIH